MSPRDVGYARNKIILISNRVDIRAIKIEEDLFKRIYRANKSNKLYKKYR